MTPSDHVQGEMRELPFDEHGVDALLDGKVVADDAPPGFQGVTRLVQAAKAPGTTGELAGEDHVVATMAAVVDGSSEVTSSIHERRRPMLASLVTAKVAAAAAAAILGGGVAAAATGSLPASLQSTVSHGLSSVDISVPNPDVHATGHAAISSSGTSAVQGTGTANATAPTTHAVGPSATGSALYGLCTDYTASSGSKVSSNSAAFRNLKAAATAKHETVAQYCTGVVPTTTAPGAASSSHASATASPLSGTATANAAGQAAGGITGTTSVTASGTTSVTAAGTLTGGITGATSATASGTSSVTAATTSVTAAGNLTGGITGATSATAAASRL